MRIFIFLKMNISCKIKIGLQSKSSLNLTLLVISLWVCGCTGPAVFTPSESSLSFYKEFKPIYQKTVKDPDFWKVVQTTPADKHGNAIVTNAMIDGLLEVKGIQEGIALYEKNITGAKTTRADLLEYQKQAQDDYHEAVKEDDLEKIRKAHTILRDATQQTNLLLILMTLSPELE